MNTERRRLIRKLSRGAAWIALLFMLAPPVSAHANLIDASPASNARLDTSPVTVRLTFTEPVEPTFSRISLLDLSGAEILNGGQVDPTDAHALTLPITQALPDDIYTVVWRVVSAADGHSTRGSYAFGVGMAAGTRAVITIDEGFNPASAAARWLDTLGTALTLGVLAFTFMVWQPGLAQGLPAQDRRFKYLLWAGWILYGSGLILGLLAQIGTATGGSAFDAITDGSAVRLLTGSGYGLIWIGRAAVWIAFGAILYGAAARPSRWGMLTGLAVWLAVMPSLISHARAAGSADALINDMAHRVASALWVGGLTAWVAALWPDFTLTAKPIGRAVSRFSNLARFYVLLLAAGGLFAATQYIPSPEALLDTGYGRALTVKGVLFGLMIVLAAFNLFFVERRLKRGDDGWIPVLRVTISAEMALGAALMIMSAVMAASVPARDVLALRTQAEEQRALPQGDPYFGMVVTDDVMMHFEVSPGLAGENEFIVAPYLLPNALPIEDATRVRLRFTHTTQNLGESTLDAISTGDGFYAAKGTNISIPGPWRVRVTLQRPGAFDTVHDFDINISE